MTFAILSDLHLGHTGNEHSWHNRLLFRQADPIARAAVAALNREALDAVYVLGDVTQAGEDRQLAQAREVLSGLAMPWFVLPGNHDRDAMHSGRFDAVFDGHLLPEFTMQDGFAIASLREYGSSSEGGIDRYQLDKTRMSAIFDQLQHARPDVLFVFTHQPLVGEAEWAAAHNGKDAGYYRDGRAFLDHAARLAGHVVAFCGHQHWHHVADGPGWRQCATAAMIEYPMEARIVTWEHGRLTSRMLAVAPELAARSLATASWVRGRDEDREWAK